MTLIKAEVKSVFQYYRCAPQTLGWRVPGRRWYVECSLEREVKCGVENDFSGRLLR